MNLSLLHLIRTACILAALATSSPGADPEHAAPAREGWWGAIDLGAGSVRQTVAGASTSDILFYASFTVGGTLNPQLLAGVELGGWLYEASDRDDPSRGEGLMQILAVARWYPDSGSRLHFRAGGGLLDHWRNRSEGGTGRNWGYGYEVGLGYDRCLSDSGVSVTPQLLFAGGRTGDEKFTAISLAIGLTWH